MKLVYYHNEYVNYGDLLSPYIIKALTSEEIIDKYVYDKTFERRIKNTIKLIIKRRFFDIPKILWPWESNLLAIGSILYGSNNRSKIWGSGFLHENDIFNGGEIYAVRGYKTLNRLSAIPDLELGNCRIGDPAVLLPLLIKKEDKPYDYEIGIIPHIDDYERVYKRYSNRYHIINLNNCDIEEITHEILSCKFIVSSSLHGIIVPHAYGIPALHFELSTDKSNDKEFKFLDYFSSVDIPYYDPISNLDSFLFEFEKNEHMDKYLSMALPNKCIKDIQQELLSVAPFIINKEY